MALASSSCKARFVLDRRDGSRLAERALGEADAFPLYHLEHPASEGADGAQAADVTMQHAQGVLHRSVDVGGAAGDARVAANVGLRGGQQRGEGDGIATLRRCNELKTG